MDRENNYTILVVEDDQIMIECYRDLLAHDFRMHISVSGREALNAISSRSDIELIVLDCRLPDISGIEVLRESKAIKPFIPVILVTGYGDESLAVKAFRYGVRDYLKKPICFKELARRIRFILSLKKTASGQYRNAFVHEEPANGICNDKIQKAIKFIDDNFMAKISLDTVARKACLSKYHFSRTFKEVMGMTCQTYITRTRIERAQSLLRTTGLKITDIALSVGYDDITHFIRIFKRITGSTPSEYKKRSQELAPITSSQ